MKNSDANPETGMELNEKCLVLFDAFCQRRSVIPLACLMHAWPWTDCMTDKSFTRKGGGDDESGGGGSFKGEKRGNDTHASRTDGDARLFRKGNTASELRYMGHALSDNRHGLIVNARVSRADGYAERDAAERMIDDARQTLGDDETPVTLGADKGYGAQEFIEACEQLKVAPHVAQNTSNRRSAVADEIAGSVGYALSQQKRKLIEQSFGWIKMVGRMRQVMVRGLKKVDQKANGLCAKSLVRFGKRLGRCRTQQAVCRTSQLIRMENNMSRRLFVQNEVIHFFAHGSFSRQPE